MSKYQSDVIQAINEAAKKHGWTREGTAALLGMTKYESSYNPYTIGDYGRSFGIFQVANNFGTARGKESRQDRFVSILKQKTGLSDPLQYIRDVKSGKTKPDPKLTRAIIDSSIEHFVYNDVDAKINTANVQRALRATNVEEASAHLARATRFAEWNRMGKNSPNYRKRVEQSRKHLDDVDSHTSDLNQSSSTSEIPSDKAKDSDTEDAEVERIPESRRKAIETLRNSEQYKHHSTEKINEIVEDVVKNVPGANIDNVLDKLSSGVERLNFSSMSDLLPGTAPIEIAVQQTQSELTQQTSPVTPDQQPSDSNQQAEQPKKISSGFHKSTNMLNKVDPMLKEGLLQGAVRAFGDPNDPKTRYELRINNAVRPGDSGKHGKGKAADVQIYDRQTKQFVGGSDIFKSGLGANAYGIQQALVRGGYQYLYEKYGKKAADRFTWGGNFIAKQFKKRGFAGLDTMHVSLDEHGRHGSVAGGPTKEVAEWLKSQGVQFESDRMDLAKWRSVYNTTYETSLTQSGEEVQQMISATRTTTAPAIFDAAIATTPAAAPTAEPAAGTNKKTASLNSYDVRDVRAMTQAADTQAQNDAQNKAISSVLNTHAMDAAQDGPATTPTPAAPTLPTPAAPAAPADPFRGAFSSPNINNSNAVTTANVPQVSSTPAVDPQDGPGTPSPPTVSPSMPSIVAAATPVAPPPPKTQNFSLDGAFVPSNPSVVTTNPDDIAARAASTRMTERTTEGGGSASSGAGGGGQGPSSTSSQNNTDYSPPSPGSTGQSHSDESLCWV